MKKFSLFLSLIFLTTGIVAQSITIMDSLINYLIKINEIDTIIGGNSTSYYYDAIHVVPIIEIQNKTIGVYYFGVNSTHSDEFLFILKEPEIKILSEDLENEIAVLLIFFEENKNCLNIEDVVQCLEKVLFIKKGNKNYEFFEILEHNN